MLVVVLWLVIGFLFAAAYKKWITPVGDEFDPLGGLLIIFWPMVVPMVLLLGLLWFLYRLIPVRPKRP